MIFDLKDILLLIEIGKGILEMSNYRDLSELLESNSGAMAFYNSLPISLQQRMYKSGVETFEQLYDCACQPKTHGERECIFSAASANDCTGLIQQGSDRSEEEWKGYRNIEPFGLPRADG